MKLPQLTEDKTLFAVDSFKVMEATSWIADESISSTGSTASAEVQKNVTTIEVVTFF